jgi:protein tyrosine phosphatase
MNAYIVLPKQVQDDDFVRAVKMEYKHVCKMAPFLDPTNLDHEDRFLIANHFKNMSKNRYSNVMADDKTCVMLGLDKHNYINANYVFDDYIATQAPIKPTKYRPNGTIDDFWLMVWQQQSQVIVMLTKFYENGCKKAEHYWPKIGQTTYDDIIVTNMEIIKLNTITITKLMIQKDNESRIVHHLHYQEWPDMGIPESTECLRQLISWVDFYQMHNNKLKGRIICHCSAGLGRAGTFIAAHHVISSLGNMDYAQIDIADVVVQMRMARNGMIQTPEQYLFVYLIINDWIMSKKIVKRRKLSRTKSLCILSSRSVETKKLSLTASCDVLVDCMDG